MITGPRDTLKRARKLRSEMTLPEVMLWRAHDGTAAAKRDAARSDFLRSQHVATLRVPAIAVIKDLEAVVTRIVEVCEERAVKIRQRQGKPPVPLHHPADGPPPRAGEERP